MKVEPPDLTPQIIAMGVRSYHNGETECPFFPRSRAAIFWREGFELAKQFPLFPAEVLSEAHRLEQQTDNKPTAICKHSRDVAKA